MNIQFYLEAIKKRTGLTDKKIGDRIGAPQPTVTRLRNGIFKDPPHSRGLAIEKMAREVCPELFK